MKKIFVLLILGLFFGSCKLDQPNRGDLSHLPSPVYIQYQKLDVDSLSYKAPIAVIYEDNVYVFKDGSYILYANSSLDPIGTSIVVFLLTILIILMIALMAEL